MTGDLGSQAGQLGGDRAETEIGGDRRRGRRGGAPRVASAPDAAAPSASGSGCDGDVTNRLARMLARAPMMPMPENMTNTAVMRPTVVTG